MSEQDTRNLKTVAEYGNDLVGKRDDVFICKECLEKALAELLNPEIVLGPD